MRIKINPKENIMVNKTRCGSRSAIVAALLSLLLSDVAIGAGDPKRGAQVFQACMACHSVKSGEHVTGPSLANNFDSDTNVVDVAVRRLRAKIDDPFPRKVVHTVRGMGYVIEERE